MDWDRDLTGWPLSHISRRIAHPPHHWHVQETGTGPTLLLLHGAGASTHSWRDVIPHLAETHHVVALDLPGQGFTRCGAQGRYGLAPMTEDIAALCAAQGWQPTAIVGHSAGAAVALALARRLEAPGGGAPAVIGINAALGRFEGVAGWLFPLIARALALNPLTATVFAAGGGTPRRARRLIDGTGSKLDEAGIGLYARLIGDRAHVAGTLRMMAQWNVDALVDDLPAIEARCLLITGDRDTAVDPAVSERAARALPSARHMPLAELGHLAHEEAPQRVGDLILDHVRGDAPA